MLRGYESLLRIIGKRRRSVPNRETILSESSSSFQWSKDEIAKSDPVEQNAHMGDENDADLVDCPVCGARFPGGDNALINSHLDLCLSKGGKRKLRQRALLQFNFSGPKVKVHSTGLDEEAHRHSPSHCNWTSSSSTVHKLNNFNDPKKHNDNHHSVSLENKPVPSCLRSLVAEGIANINSASPTFDSGIDRPNVLDEGLEDSDLSKVIIPTFIVGRRYYHREDLDDGLRIYLFRDLENPRDQNALKVLCADHGYDSMLGYVPRELAQLLSPLIDKFHLNFEGHVTSVPEDSGTAVPIQVVCKNVQLYDQTICENIQEFKSLWRNVLHAVELAKTDPLGMTRYWRNLKVLMQDVLRSNPHLFTSSEMSFLEEFNSIPDDGQRLFARLCTRKGPWFRMSKISYPEISDYHQAIKGLLDAGYVCSFTFTNELELVEVLGTLSVHELHEALSVLKKKCKHGARKQELISLVVSSCKDGNRPELQRFFLEVTGSCIKVSPLAESLIWRAERLFFFNGDLDLSTFLLIDLGIVKYPVYRCIISGPIFSNRGDLLSYEEALGVSQIMIESIDENKPECVLRCIEVSVSRMSILPEEGKSSSGGPEVAFLSQFSASFLYSKVVSLGVSFIEREKRYTDAINLLRELLKVFISDRRRGLWTLRLSVDLEHLGHIDESLQVAEGGLLDQWVRAGSRIALQRRVLRLGKPPRRWKKPKFSETLKKKIFEVHIQGRPLNCKTGMKSIFYSVDGEQCGVEQLALQYYAGEGGGWQGVHAESGIWLTIFGILMWDVIFADVPNVFQTKFQTSPLDLETDSFYDVRKSLIEARLEEIGDGMAEEILITVWESQVGTACRGVNWDKHSLDDLRATVKCIGGPCLASFCRHLAQDYRSWSSGMPDLLLWRLHDCYRGEAKLVEVKGPRDRLSEQQRAWLLVLMDSGFNVEICKVTPAPAET